MAVLVKQLTVEQLLRGRYSDGTTFVRPSERFVNSFVSGGGVAEAQQYYEFTGTAGSGGTTLDLSGGSAVTDIFGAALGLTNVHAFCMNVTTTTTGAGITLTGDFITSIFASTTSLLVHAGGSLEWSSEIGKDISASGNTIGYVRTGSVDTAFRAFVIGTVLEEA